MHGSTERHRLYEATLKVIREKVKDCKVGGISTDEWTSPSQESWGAITFLGVNSKHGMVVETIAAFKISKYVKQLTRVQKCKCLLQFYIFIVGDQTADGIAGTLKDKLADFFTSVNVLIKFITTDAAATVRGTINVKDSSDLRTEK